MSTVSRTHSVEVVSSITPISIPVSKRALFIQFGMLCFAMFMTIRAAQILFNRISSQRATVVRDDE
jgi:hypothetical protein